MDQDGLRKALAQPDAVLELGVMQTVAAFIQSGGQPQEVIQLLSDGYVGEAQMCNLLVGWLDKALQALPPAEVAQRKHVEVHQVVEEHLKQLLVDRFDPRQADKVLLEGSEASTLVWLRPLIDHANYRTMIYQLSQQHENCVLLNFAIQTICDAGFQHEIAGLATASRYIQVFSRVLVDAIVAFHQEDELSLSDRFAEFAKSSTSGVHTYLFSRLLLQRAVDETKAVWLERLAEEMAEGVKQHGRIASQLSNLISGAALHPKLADSISAVMSANSTSPGDIMNIYSIYQGDSAPSLSIIRQTRFLEILLKDIFNPDNPTAVPSQHRAMYMWVLAAAVSSPEEREDTLHALETIDGIIKSNPIGFALQAAMLDLVNALKYPIVAQALMQWLQKTIAQPDFYPNNYTAVSAVPHHFLLIEEIAIRFPVMRPQVFYMFSREFQNPPSFGTLLQLIDFRKMIIDRLIFLVSLGFVTPVVRFMLKDLPTTDLAIAAYFFDKFFAVAQLPYSPTLSRILLHMLSIPSIPPALIVNRSLLAPINAFLAHCDNDTTLDPDAKALLPNLHLVFPVPT